MVNFWTEEHCCHYWNGLCLPPPLSHTTCLQRSIVCNYDFCIAPSLCKWKGVTADSTTPSHAHSSFRRVFSPFLICLKGMTRVCCYYGNLNHSVTSNHSAQCFFFSLNFHICPKMLKLWSWKAQPKFSVKEREWKDNHEIRGWAQLWACSITLSKNFVFEGFKNFRGVSLFIKPLSLAYGLLQPHSWNLSHGTVEYGNWWNMWLLRAHFS